MSYTKALKSGQKVFKGSRSLDFMSNSVKTSNISPITTTENHEIVGEVEHPIDFNKIPLLHSIKPIHPFLRHTKAQELELYVTKFQNTKSLLIQEIDSNDVVTVTNSMNKLVSYNLIMNYFKDIEELRELKLAEKYELPIFELDLQLPAHSNIFEQTLKGPNGEYITNEHKMFYFIDQKLDLGDENSIKNTLNLISSYMEVSSSLTSTKSVVLKLLDKLTQQSCPTYTYEIIKDIYKASIHFHPNFMHDEVYLTSWIQFFNSNSKDVLFTLSLIRELIALDYSIPTTELNRFLKNLNLQVKNNGERLKLLIGLDDVIYTSMDGTTMPEITRFIRNVDEVQSLLDIIDKRYGDQEYTKFGNDLIETILYRFPKLEQSMKYELIQRVKAKISISDEVNLKILKDVVKNGNFILASKICKEIPNLNKQEIIEIANERELTGKLKPGFTNLYKKHFISTI